MKLEIKKIIQSSRQVRYVIFPTIEVSSKDELIAHPTVEELVGSKNFSLERGVDSGVNFWYLTVID